MLGQKPSLKSTFQAAERCKDCSLITTHTWCPWGGEVALQSQGCTEAHFHTFSTCLVPTDSPENYFQAPEDHIHSYGQGESRAGHSTETPRSLAFILGSGWCPALLLAELLCSLWQEFLFIARVRLFGLRI